MPVVHKDVPVGFVYVDRDWAALWQRLVVGSDGIDPEFVIRYDVGGVVVAERVAPAAEQAVKPG